MKNENNGRISAVWAVILIIICAFLGYSNYEKDKAIQQGYTPCSRCNP